MQKYFIHRNCKQQGLMQKYFLQLGAFISLILYPSNLNLAVIWICIIFMLESQQI